MQPLRPALKTEYPPRRPLPLGDILFPLPPLQTGMSPSGRGRFASYVLRCAAGLRPGRTLASSPSTSGALLWLPPCDADADDKGTSRLPSSRFPPVSRPDAAKKFGNAFEVPARLRDDATNDASHVANAPRPPSAAGIAGASRPSAAHFRNFWRQTPCVSLAGASRRRKGGPPSARGRRKAAGNLPPLAIRPLRPALKTESPLRGPFRLETSYPPPPLANRMSSSERGRFASCDAQRDSSSLG